MPDNEGREGKDVDALVRQYRTQIQQRERVADIAVELAGIRNITLPLDLLTHIYLEILAEKLGTAKTAVAVEILTNALRDVYTAVQGQPLSEDEIRDYFKRHEQRLLQASKEDGNKKAPTSGDEKPDATRFRKNPTL
jgi:hypothetical protein